MLLMVPQTAPSSKCQGSRRRVRLAANEGGEVRSRLCYQTIGQNLLGLDCLGDEEYPVYLLHQWADISSILSTCSRFQTRPGSFSHSTLQCYFDVRVPLLLALFFRHISIFLLSSTRSGAKMKGKCSGFLPNILCQSLKRSAVLQRVASASVTVDSVLVSSIGKGVLVFAAVAKDDTHKEVESMAAKVLKLKMWPDDTGGTVCVHDHACQIPESADSV